MSHDNETLILISEINEISKKLENFGLSYGDQFGELIANEIGHLKDFFSTEYRDKLAQWTDRKTT
jgi:hypothetical protein